MPGIFLPKVQKCFYGKFEPTDNSGAFSDHQSQFTMEVSPLNKHMGALAQAVKEATANIRPV